MYSVKLIRREEIAEGVMQFRFERPQGFDYQAGQYIDITLLDPLETDTEGNRRSFSLASAPHESELMIMTRIRGTAFKRNLKTMPLGAEVRLEGPYGSFTLHNDATRSAVFIASGIGITPFLSMMKDTRHRKLPHKIYLLQPDELHTPVGENPIYYLAGPQDTVLAARDCLLENGVSRDDIRLDQFAGY